MCENGKAAETRRWADRHPPGPPGPGENLKTATANAAPKGYGDASGMGGARFMSDAEILTELFTYHPPNEVTAPRFQAINRAAKNFAEVVLETCMPSADRSAAIRQIREARMTANAAVALGGLSL
jgi:hypothetical protein